MKKSTTTNPHPSKWKSILKWFSLRPSKHSTKTAATTTTAATTQPNPTQHRHWTIVSMNSKSNFHGICSWGIVFNDIALLSVRIRMFKCCPWFHGYHCFITNEIDLQLSLSDFFAPSLSPEEMEIQTMFVYWNSFNGALNRNMSIFLKKNMKIKTTIKVNAINKCYMQNKRHS